MPVDGLRLGVHQEGRVPRKARCVPGLTHGHHRIGTYALAVVAADLPCPARSSLPFTIEADLLDLSISERTQWTTSEARTQLRIVTPED